MDFSSTFLNFSPALATFLLALLPLTELRAAIPIGIFVYHLSPISAFFFAVAGNLLAAYLVLMLIDPVAKYLKIKFKIVNSVLDWWFNRVFNQFVAKYQKYGPLALVIFVAIPLPATGAWTGAIAAWLFKINSRLAILYIGLGVMIAGLIVTLISTGVLKSLSFLI